MNFDVITPYAHRSSPAALKFPEAARTWRCPTLGVAEGHRVHVQGATLFVLLQPVPCSKVRAPLPCSPRRFASTILPSPVQDSVLVRAAPMGRARDRGRGADCHRPQEWCYGSVHAATSARFRGVTASPRTGAPRRQFRPCSLRGRAPRKLTNRVARRLPDHAARPAPVGPIPQTRSGSRRCGVHPRQGLLLDKVPVLRSSTRLRRTSADFCHWDSICSDQGRSSPRPDRPV